LVNEDIDDAGLQHLTSLLVCLQNNDYATAGQWQQYISTSVDPVITVKFMMGLKSLIAVGKAAM
jgi:hypothetical protein